MTQFPRPSHQWDGSGNSHLKSSRKVKKLNPENLHVDADVLVMVC
jgi:hypothetical protein